MPTISNGLIAVLVALAICGGGYWAGYSRADSARVAEVATIRAEHAQALAIAEQQALERLEEETAKANALAARAQETKTQIVVQTRTITKRIPYAAQSAAGCSFGPDFVQLYNAALGYSGGAAVSQGSGAAGADSSGGPAPAPGTELLPDKPVTPPVTPADLLAHARDYGAWARTLEAQLKALAELVKDGR